MPAMIGQLIRQERLRQNLSQEGLARGICAASYLSKIEQGQVEPGAEILERLCAALGIDYRSDPALLAQAVMELYRERTVRIYRGTQQYITEEQEWK